MSTRHFSTLSSFSCALHFARCLAKPVHSSLSLEPSDLVLFSTHTIKRAAAHSPPQGPGGRRKRETRQSTYMTVSRTTFHQRYHLGRTNPQPACFLGPPSPTVPRADEILSWKRTPTSYRLRTAASPAGQGTTAHCRRGRRPTSRSA